MKTEVPNLLGVAIRDYFTDHLPRLRGTSPHTVHSYRDSLVLLLRFVSRLRSKPISELDLADLDPTAILAFLSYLEQERKNGVSTRNVRLSAVHAFILWLRATPSISHWRSVFSVSPSSVPDNVRSIT